MIETRLVLIKKATLNQLNTAYDLNNCHCHFFSVRRGRLQLNRGPTDIRYYRRVQRKHSCREIPARLQNRTQPRQPL